MVSKTFGHYSLYSEKPAYEVGVKACRICSHCQYTRISLSSAAPEAAPAITEGVSFTATSIHISWSAPAVETHNGILIDYVVCYATDSELPMDMWQKTSAPTTTITLTGLSIFTEYTVSVAAATVAGVGPYDSVTVQTLSGSKSSTHVSTSYTYEIIANFQ